MVGVVAGVVAAAGAGLVLVVVLGAVEVVVLGVVDVVVLGVVDVVEVVVGAVVAEVEVVVGDVGVVLVVMVLVVLVRVVPGLDLSPPGLCVELPVGLLVAGALAELERTCPYCTGRPRAGPMICGATMLAGPGTNSPRATAAAPPAKPRPPTA